MVNQLKYQANRCYEVSWVLWSVMKCHECYEVLWSVMSVDFDDSVEFCKLWNIAKHCC